MGTRTTSRWRRARDPLFRGDSAAGVTEPEPRADPSVVRHVLYLDGAGRPTPYHSTTEEHATARRFAGSKGRVYSTTVARATACGARHVSNAELMDMLRGHGKGDAKWKSAHEVMVARKYVEMWSEHLLDYRAFAGARAAAAAAREIFG